MSKYVPEYPESIKKDLETLAEYMTADRPSELHEVAFTRYLMKTGIDISVRVTQFDIPHGKTRKEFRHDVVKLIREELLPEAGLSSIAGIRRKFTVIDGSRVIGYIEVNDQYTNASIAVVLTMPVELATDLQGRLKETITVNAIKVDRLKVDTRNDAIRADKIVLPEVKHNLDSKLLYPGMKYTPESLWDAFKESDSNVLLFIGSPGLGKSSFIRRMIDYRDSGNVYIADNNSVMTHVGLTDYIRGIDHESILVIEDADDIVRKREVGNTIMQPLLNVASGIIPTNTKIIITTNLPSLKNVDEALLRPGRMFKILEFKPLTVEQAHTLRKEMGLGEVDFGELREVTLAEATNWHELNGEVVKDQPMGFLR